MSPVNDHRVNVEERLKKLDERLKSHSSYMLGYPVNLKYDYSSIFPFFKYSLNNVGDPFVKHDYNIQTKDFEQEVIAFFAKVYKFPADTWGYVTSGGTEGNLYGLYVGRELLGKPKIIYSGDAHYSIPKLAKILAIEAIKISSQENGECDYDYLDKVVMDNKDQPLLFSLNIGTTVKGAIDDIGKVVDILKKYKITKYYIHCDAALFGGYLPFIDNPHIQKITEHADSIAISGHKFFGSPVPSGIVLAKKKRQRVLKEYIEYIGSVDTTISGSRNGHSVLMLWQMIQEEGERGLTRRANQCMENTAYLVKELSNIGINSLRNDFSNTVLIKQPSKEICSKWQLAKEGEFAHIIVMPHVTKEMIDRLIEHLRRA